MALLHASRPSTGCSRVPVNRPSPSSVYWILVSSLEILKSWKSWRCSPCRCHHEFVIIDVESSILTPLPKTHTNPVYYSIALELNNVPGGNREMGSYLMHSTQLQDSITLLERLLKGCYYMQINIGMENMVKVNFPGQLVKILSLLKTW